MNAIKHSTIDVYLYPHTQKSSMNGDSATPCTAKIILIKIASITQMNSHLPTKYPSSSGSNMPMAP
jgi:hypothetical protein